MFADGTAHPLGSTYDGYLPNITGITIGSNDSNYVSGAFYQETNGQTGVFSSSGNRKRVGFDASRSSAAYGRNSSEFGGFVLPRSLHMFYIIKY